MVNLVIADDHQIVRQGLRAVLQGEPDFRVVGEAADGLEALKLVERLRPDVLVLDLMMPNLNGLEVLRRVARGSARPRVVVLSMHANEAYAHEALRAGAVAYVLKDHGAKELAQAIRSAVEGTRYLSALLSDEALRAYARKAGEPSSAPDPLRALTDREREVLQLTAEGHTGGDIARRLFISPRTVETHRANLMRKLKVRNQKELVRYALQRAPQAPGPVLSRSPA